MIVGPQPVLILGILGKRFFKKKKVGQQNLVAFPWLCLCLVAMALLTNDVAEPSELALDGCVLVQLRNG